MTKSDLKIQIDEDRKKLAAIQALEQVQAIQSSQVIAELIIEGLGERSKEVAKIILEDE